MISGVSTCEVWLATNTTGPSTRSRTSSPCARTDTCERSSEFMPTPSTTSRTPRMSGVRAQRVGNTRVERAGTYGSAERGTSARRPTPQRQPRATVRTSRTPSRTHEIGVVRLT